MVKTAKTKLDFENTNELIALKEISAQVSHPHLNNENQHYVKQWSDAL